VATTTKPATTATKPATTATKPATTTTSKPAATKSTSTTPAKGTTASKTTKPAAAPKATTAAPSSLRRRRVRPWPSPGPVTPPGRSETGAAPGDPAARDDADGLGPAGAPTPVAAPAWRSGSATPSSPAFWPGCSASVWPTPCWARRPRDPSGTASTPGNVLEPVAAGLATAETAGQLTRLAFFGGLVALA